MGYEMARGDATPVDSTAAPFAHTREEAQALAGATLQARGMRIWGWKNSRADSTRKLQEDDMPL
jgi:hypothetical protein